MGCDIRILQIEGAKDPDEYIIKYGNARFNVLVEKAISIIEFKVKLLKKNLNLDNINDKIKFLNEIAKLISKIDNTMEREVYIEKISKEYEISKEAIYAEVNKIIYANSRSENNLEKSKTVIKHIQEQKVKISESTIKRENTIISLLLMGDFSIYQILKQNIKIEDFQYEINKEIVKRIYEEFEKGNDNINAIIDDLEQEEQNQITKIMAEDYEITDVEKAIDDIMQSYEKEKLNNRKYEILEKLEIETDNETKKSLEKELSEIIIKLAKIK